MEDLPEEMVLSICDKMTFRALYNFVKTSKTNRRICYEKLKQRLNLVTNEVKAGKYSIVFNVADVNFKFFQGTPMYTNYIQRVYANDENDNYNPGHLLDHEFIIKKMDFIMEKRYVTYIGISLGTRKTSIGTGLSDEEFKKILIRLIDDNVALKIESPDYSHK